MDGMKLCGSCHAEKPAVAFYKRAASSDGLANRCKECDKAYVKAWKARNAERHAAQQAEYRAGRSEELKQWRRAFYTQHKEEINAANSAYYHATKPGPVLGPKRPRKTQAEIARAWRERHPLKARELNLKQSTKRRALRRDAFVEHVDRVEVLVRDGGICYLCGEGVDTTGFHLDHVVPLSKGGKHCYTNVAVTHPHCNQRKWANSSYPKMEAL